VVRLEHHGLPTHDLRDEHERGWTHFMGRLAETGSPIAGSADREG
jgi:hypothetical protein